MPNKRRIIDKAKQTRQYYNASEAVAAELAEAYLEALTATRREAEKVFATFAGNYNLTQAEARHLLDKHSDVGTRSLLRKAVNAMPPGPEKERMLAEISAPAYQYRINRLETLQAGIEDRLKSVAKKEVALAKSHYTKVIRDSYLYGIYDVQRTTGLSFNFHDLSDRAVGSILNAKWPQLGIKYSEAIWGDTAAIAQRIRQDILISVMSGQSGKHAIARIEEDFRVRAYEARRLVRTETARMSAEADKASMSECGIEEYEFRTTLDEATCSRCGSMDGKTFPVDSGVPGVNMGPLHPNCGCYTVPVVEDFGVTLGSRIARDPITGNNVKVPADMTYSEWRKALVTEHGQTQVDMAYASQLNAASDEVLYANYKARLGDVAPKSVGDFRQLKYAQDDEWGKLQAQYRAMGYYDKAVANEPQITAMIQEIAEQAGMQPAGLEFRIKGKDSYLRKVLANYDPAGTSYEVKDILRYTYLDDPATLADKTNAAIAAFAEKGYNTTAVKNTWLRPNVPYRGINTNVTSPAGQVFEVQYHTPESFALKNGKLHELYEKARLLDEDSDEYIKLTKEMIRLSNQLTVPDNIGRVKR